MQDEINHLQTEVESLRSGGTMESMDKDATKAEMLIHKKEIIRLTEELMKSDTGKQFKTSKILDVTWNYKQQVAEKKKKT